LCSNILKEDDVRVVNGHVPLLSLFHCFPVGLSVCAGIRNMLLSMLVYESRGVFVYMRIIVVRSVLCMYTHCGTRRSNDVLMCFVVVFCVV
jgi:hypothetical protein